LWRRRAGGRRLSRRLLRAPAPRLSSAGSWIEGGSAGLGVGQLRRTRGVPRALGRTEERGCCPLQRGGPTPRADSDGLRLRTDPDCAAPIPGPWGGPAVTLDHSLPHTSRVRLFASGGAQHGRRCAVCMPAAGRRRVAVTAVCAGLQHLLHRQEWCLV
jgi:hypothetical protein